MTEPSELYVPDDWSELSNVQMQEHVRTWNALIEADRKQHIEQALVAQYAQNAKPAQQQPKQQPQQQPAQSGEPFNPLLDHYKRSHGLGSLPKDWNQDRVAANLWGLDYGARLVSEGKMSVQDLDILRHSIVRDEMGDMPTAAYINGRKTGLVDDMLGRAPPRGYTEERAKEVANKLLVDAYNKSNDIGYLNDSDYVDRMHQIKAIPSELLDPNGMPAASAEHVAAEMDGLRTAEALGIKDVRPGSLVVDSARPTKPLDVSSEEAVQWKQTASHGRAGLKNKLLNDHNEYAATAKEQAKAITAEVRTEYLEAKAEAANTSPPDTLSKIFDAALKKL